MAIVAPERLYFTDDDEANELIAHDPLALLIGFALDQQVTVQSAFSGPLEMKQRLGSLDAATIAGTDPAGSRPRFASGRRVHRFPGAMAHRVQELCARYVVPSTTASRARLDGGLGLARPAPPLGAARVRRHEGQGPGRCSSSASGSPPRPELAPKHPTLGDVDSPQALDEYQAAKRAYKAAMRAKAS